MFFNPLLDKKKTFKLITDFLPNKHYVCKSTGLTLEYIEDMHDFYIKRESYDNLSFMQFMQFYKGKSNPIEVDYEENVTESDIPIQTSEGPEGCLPQILTLNCGKKMILQRKPNLVYTSKIEQDTEEHMQMMAVFYYPHTEVGPLLEKESLEKLYGNLVGI